MNPLSVNDKTDIHQTVNSLLSLYFMKNSWGLKPKEDSHGKQDHHGSRFSVCSIKNHLKQLTCFKFFFHDQNPQHLSCLVCKVTQSLEKALITSNLDSLMQHPGHLCTCHSNLAASSSSTFLTKRH